VCVCVCHYVYVCVCADALKLVEESAPVCQW